MNSNVPAASKFRRIAYRLVLSTALAAALMWLMTTGLTAALEKTHFQPQAALNRFGDPIVITGTRFPAFSGVPLSELVVYAYHGGEWAPIPFQIDEVNISGTYVISDDGLLGDRDELVFMAGDAGDSASPTAWPTDPSARLNPRYAITVTDPLSGSQQAWTYLYRSSTLTRSKVSYVTWTYATQTASAVSYTAAFSPSKFVGLSDLFINGGNVDILDRQKTRVQAVFILPFTLTEESILPYVVGGPTLTLPINGPVRAATNNGALKAAFYGSRIDFDVTFDLSSLPLTINSIRTSFDWISPTISGIHTYYDSNTPVGVTIDGVTDTISTTPRANWFQVNGYAAGPGGLVMTIPRINPQGGTVTNYYKDNRAIDQSDTGDKQSFGDAGLLINNPGSIISFTLMAYVLPPGTDTNVGAAYFARANNPLQAATVKQCNTPTGECVEIRVPPNGVNVAGPSVGAISRPYTFTVTVTPIAVTTPITYVYQATDQVGITRTGGSTDSVAFTWSTIGPKTISVTAMNDAGRVTTTHAIELFVPPAHAVVTGTTLARVDYPYTYVASVSPVTASLPITYIWQATDHSPVTVVSEISNSMTFTWTTVGFKNISVTVYNNVGMVSSDPLPVWVGRFIFLPITLRNAP